jgi:hypothetical protein
MRTKIVGVWEAGYGRLEVDEWIPFSFRAYNRLLIGPLYWTAGNHRTSLLEMKVERTGGAVMAAVLSSCQRFAASDPSGFFDGVPEVPGLPVVQLDDFEHDMCWEEADFSLSRAGNRFFATLDDSPRPRRCLRSDRVGFFENDGELCAIGFFDLTEAEVRTVLTWCSGQAVNASA